MGCGAACDLARCWSLDVRREDGRSLGKLPELDRDLRNLGGAEGTSALRRVGTTMDSRQ